MAISLQEYFFLFFFLSILYLLFKLKEKLFKFFSGCKSCRQHILIYVQPGLYNSLGSLTSCFPFSCPLCHPWWHETLENPLYFHLPYFWEPHLESSLGHSEGILGLAILHRYPSSCLGKMCPWVSWLGCKVTLLGQILLSQGHLHGIGILFLLRHAA